MSDSLLFYNKVQSFVDSKEKTIGGKNKDRTVAKKVEYWLLIKVVCLSVKAAPLLMGVVIVDLPGVHDPNAAC